MSRKNGKPSGNGRNGNRPTTFKKGNKAAVGRGQPHGTKIVELRKAMFDAITTKDLRHVVASLIEAAKSGDVMAARELLSRVVGKPADALDADNLVQKVLVFDPDQRQYAALVMDIGDGDVSPEARNRALDGM